MIATTRGLVVLAVIAAILVVATLVTNGEHTAPGAQGGASPHDPADFANLGGERAIFPGFDETKVNQINFSWGQTGDSVRRVGNEWRIDEDTLASPAAIDAIFTALRGGRWHRRVKPSAIRQEFHSHGPSGITINGKTFSRGPALEGTGQTWLLRDNDRAVLDPWNDDALLVDDWIVKALIPGWLGLRIGRPINCATAKTITATAADLSVRLEGTRLVVPHRLWLDERWTRPLRDACANVEIVASNSKRVGPEGLHIVADGELKVMGACYEPTMTYVEAKVIRGCVQTDALRELEKALRALVGPPLELIDQRPLPIDPVTLTLQDGKQLELGNAPRVDGKDADPDAVRELVRALGTRGESVVERSNKKPTATIKAIDAAGIEVTLELFDHAIARAGEPAAIRIADADWSIITRPSSALRDATRWREDAMTLTSLTLDTITYKRGAVLGEWTRTPDGKLDAALVDSLVETLASVRAPATAPPAAIAHRLRVTFTPPAGKPVTHTIDFASPTAHGCAARLDGVSVLLPLPLCTAAIALASSR
ncbi:MAG TPA: hypothetical protein VIV11_20320 [Kofleriaceae bacterium]